MPVSSHPLGGSRLKVIKYLARGRLTLVKQSCGCESKAEQEAVEFTVSEVFDFRIKFQVEHCSQFSG
jgi:hypothetical protein